MIFIKNIVLVLTDTAGTLLMGKIKKVLFLAYLFLQSEEQEMHSISLKTNMNYTC